MSRIGFHAKINTLIMLSIIALIFIEDIVTYKVAGVKFNIFKEMNKVLFVYVCISIVIYYINFKAILNKVVSIIVMICLGLVCICISIYYSGYLEQKDTVNLFLSNGASYYEENDIDMPKRVNMINYLPTYVMITSNIMEDAVSYSMLSKVGKEARLPEYYYNKDIREVMDIVKLAEASRDGLSKEDQSLHNVITQINNFADSFKETTDSASNGVRLFITILTLVFFRFIGCHINGDNDGNIIDEVYKNKYCTAK